MPKSHTKTGIETLDKDIAFLFNLKPSKFKTFEKVVSNKAATIKELKDNIPPEIFNLVFHILPDSTYDTLVRQSPKTGKQLIKKARNLVMTHLADLLYHPAVVEFLVSQVTTQKNDDEKEKTPSLNLNIIHTISPAPTLFADKDDPERLTPAVRIGFLDRRRKVLLDTTLDWDDMLFVASVFLKTLASELEKRQSLAKSGILKMYDQKQIRDKIFSVQDSLKKIKKFATIYGINIKSTASKR